MKNFIALTLSVFIALAVTGCAIPDLPGPIGIPGIEKAPLSLDPQ
ncbi:MAG: hypothetical protein U9R28_02680 [Pseudomonadota bacterium]|nr:hypothetical protein [Pseudomonadota bacterium]